MFQFALIWQHHSSIKSSMRLDGSKDYRDLLKEELAFRCQCNPSYSLRAFARDLDISPSRLSEVIGRKMGMAESTAWRVAANLGLSGEEQTAFCSLVTRTHSRSVAKKKAAQKQLDSYRLSLDYETEQLGKLEEIATWHHPAILCLMEHPDFESAPSWIAKRLNISRSEAKAAIGRLIHVGLVKKEDGQLKARKGVHIRSPSDKPSEKMRSANLLVLEKAKEALRESEISQRDYSTVFLPINAADLKQAKKMILDFKRKFSKRLTQTEDKNRVYCLAISFFGLDQPQQGIKL